MGHLPIRLRTLKGGIVLGFDAYLQLSDDKTLLYVHAEDDITQERLDRLKERKVKKLFIKEDQEEKYQDYIDRCLSEAMGDNNLSVEGKADLVASATEDSAERVYKDPKSEKSYNGAKKASANLINALSQSDELLKGIFDRPQSEEDGVEEKMQKHAVNTSSLAIAFAGEMGFGEDVKELFGMAGLFHDIGYTEYEADDRSLFITPMADMKAEQLTKYKEHPKKGAEILQDKDYASKELIGLILAHEERTGGAGFPNKMSKLSEQEEAFALCCYYDYKITCLGEKREDVLTALSVDDIGLFELALVKKFKKFIKSAGMA